METAREMLAARTDEPFTFTTLAARARVSRRTLYTHWGSIEKVIRDVVALRAEDRPVDSPSLSPRDSLRQFLESMRAGIADPVTRFALAALMNQSSHDTDAARSFVDLAVTRTEHFRSSVAPVDQTTYAQLVGPILFAEFLGGEPASDELIDALVDRGVAILGLES